MATTQLSKVTVEELTKFGLKANGEYINWSKNLDDKAKIPVVPGRTFNMELYIADSGKKYVNKVLQMVETADVPKVDTTRDKKYTPKLKVGEPVPGAEGLTVGYVPKTESMTRSDWDAKDKRISRQGVIQAAVQAVANLGMCPSTEDLFPLAEELANKMLEFVGK